MPLLKLWNRLLGRRAAVAEPDRCRASQSEEASQLAGAPPTEARTEPKITPKTGAKTLGQAAAAASRGGVLGIGRRGPHAGLCKLVRPLQATTVLEISVGDGSRAQAVAETLAKAQPDSPRRYLAIDQFELAGGPVTLKQFHQRMRQANIHPQLFPDSIERGLRRVAHTAGVVDLILIADPSADWETPQRRMLLSRVIHGNSVVLRFDGEQWWRDERITGSAIGSVRAAA